ncbi:MAG: hypothetical protein ABIS03_05010 [Gemmatimonadaceae bacterium]
MSIAKAPDLAFTPSEKSLIARLSTPLRVQRFVNGLPYNAEPDGESMRGFRGVIRTGTAHCLEAALFAATVLEPHGYPPLVLGFESVDLLDHVIFLYRAPTGWGSVARSRDPGLHGRKPLFATPRALALSYAEGYVDHSGRIQGYAVVDLRVLDPYNWRLSSGNLWKVERLLREWPHRVIASSDAVFRQRQKRYREFVDTRGYKPWKYFKGRDRWTPLPPEFRRRG